jgi:hypothetical protein
MGIAEKHYHHLQGHRVCQEGNQQQATKLAAHKACFELVSYLAYALAFKG